MTAAAAGRRLTTGSNVVTVLEQQCHKNSPCGEYSRAYSPAPLRDIQYRVHLPPVNGYKDGHVQGGTLYAQERALILCPSSNTRDSSTSSTHTTDSCSTTQGPQHVGTITTTTRQVSCCKYSNTGGLSDWVGTADSALLPNIYHQHPGGTTRPQPPSLVHAIPMDPGRGRTPCSLTKTSTNVANVNTNVAATSGGGSATPTSIGRQCRSSSGGFSRRLLTLLPLYLAMLLILLPTAQVAADCSPLPSISHGNITYYQDFPNSTLQAQITCDLNYRPAGSDVIMCLPSGSWNDTIPSCELVLCESLPTIPNGEVLHSGRRVGSTANYTCIKGFRMVGSAERTCLYNATWTGTQPQCRRIVCKHPGTPVDGVADPPDDTDYPAGTTITYSCHLGYNINGSSSTVCSESGSWTKPVPYCSVMDCGTPPRVLHATPVYDSTLLGENVTYTCDVGYTSVDNTSLVCAVNASWTGQVYTCTELPHQSTTEIMTTTSDITTESTHTMSPTSLTSVKSITNSLSPESSSSSPTTTTSITTPSTSSEESTEQVSSPSTARTLPESTTHLTIEATSTSEQEVTSSTPEITSPASTARSTTSDAGDVMTTTSGRDVSTSDVSTVPVTSSTTSQGLSSSAAATLMVPTTLQTSSSGATSIATTKSEMSGEKLAIIIGIVIGSVLPVVLIAGLCFLCRRKRNRGAYEIRYNSSPKEESTIMIESSKPEVYGNGHVMGNGHDNHVTWCDESPTAHIPDISNPNNRRAPQNNHGSNGSSKDRVQGTSQNNHGNHGNMKAHAPNNHGNHSNPRDPAQRNPKNNHSSRSNTKERIQGDTVWVCMAPVRPDPKPDDPGGSGTVGETGAHRGVNGNTCVTNNNPNKTNKLTHKTAL